MPDGRATSERAAEVCYHRNRTASFDYGAPSFTPYVLRCDDCGATVRWGIHTAPPELVPMPKEATQ